MHQCRADLKDSEIERACALPTRTCKSQIFDRTMRTSVTDRLRSINTHEASDRDRAKALASGRETMTEALHSADLGSAVRRALPRPEEVRHFTWAQNSITRENEDTMKGSVDLYLDRITLANSVDTFRAREMTDAETPYEMRSPRMSLKQGPRRIVRAFDRAGIYNPKREPLAATLPDLQIVHDFKAFIEGRHEAMPPVLAKAPVAVAPPDPLDERRQARHALFDDPIYRHIKRNSP